MALQLSVAARNARLDSIETVVGATAKLQIRSGAQPANAATAASGTLLCEITLPSDWMAAASAGSKAKLGTWSGTGAAAGTAGHFRVVDNAGTTCHLQGSVTATSGGWGRPAGRRHSRKTNGFLRICRRFTVISPRCSVMS